MLIMLIIPFMRSQDLLSRRFSEALTGRNDNRSTEKYSRREEKKWNTGYIKKTVTKYETGEYGWTTDLETVKRQVDWQLKELKTVLDAMCEEKKLECLFLDTVIGTAINIDGRQSSEKTIFCPLFDGEVPPEGDKMMVRNFSL